MKQPIAYIARAQTTLDMMPPDSPWAGPSGARGGPTAREREQLDALRPELLKLLNGDGVSRGWITDRTGIPRNHVTVYLHELKAKPCPKGLWRLPSVTRLKNMNQL